MEWSGGSLDPLQRRVLGILAGFEPPFILGGGGALAIYFNHRQTRDLDLFWEEIDALADVPTLIQQRLRDGGVSTSVVQQTSAFVRLRAFDNVSAINIDLVADPTERLERPVLISMDNGEIAAESARDILVNKLCALVGRSELRDLFDIGTLISHGISLDEAIEAAPRKDGGFSPLTLAWVLQGLDVRPLMAASGFAAGDVDRIEQVRMGLIKKLLG
ncbi:MAG: hypothetical protein QOK37_173 [Thermoanaerobaculia bacterium]|jgi:hypothetical protein|nr:hypothetical protein [Thermoanaerobaculia bacterium]